MSLIRVQYSIWYIKNVDGKISWISQISNIIININIKKNVALDIIIFISAGLSWMLIFFSIKIYLW